MADPSPLPDREWLGRALAISDFVSDREFRSRGLYAEVCRPLHVRAVLKLFLPTDAGSGASLVFSTTRRCFIESDRLTLQRILLHLVQLRRNANARQTYAALMASAAAAQARLQRLTPSERVVLARAAAGDTNFVIAKALFISPGTVRKHLEHIYAKLEIHNRTEATAIYTKGLSQITMPTSNGPALRSEDGCAIGQLRTLDAVAAWSQDVATAPVLSGTPRRFGVR